MLYKNLHNYSSVIADLFKDQISQKAEILLLLSGDLGAGKTEFTTQLGSFLNLKEISSPTFALHQCYESDTYELHHWDLYRLEDQDDLESSGFWDQFSYEDKSLHSSFNKTKILIVEWPERINSVDLPLHWTIINLKITINADQTRQLEMQTVNV